MDGLQSRAVLDVLREIFTQRTQLGYTGQHDDAYNPDGELVVAAIHYVAPPDLRRHLDDQGFAMSEWHREVFEPLDPRTNLVRGAALLIAEIERLDRRDADA